MQSLPAIPDSPLQIFVSAASQRPFYLRDVLNCCCAPVGDRLTLAFSRKWVEKALLDEVNTNVGTLKKRPVLLIYCEEREQPAQGNDIFAFRPFRRATLTDIVVVGIDTLTFELQLSAFIIPDVDESSVQASLENSGGCHPNYSRVAGNPNPNAKFVRFAPDDIGKRLTEGDWNALVDRMRRYRGLNGSLFFVTTDDAWKKYPIFPLGSKWSPKTDRKEAVKRRGKEVGLTIYGVPGEKSTFHPPRVTLSEVVGRVSGPYIRQFGRGYLLHYAIQIRNGWDDDWTMVRVASEPSDEVPKAGGFHSPEIALHLRVHPATLALGFVVLLFLVGSFFTSLDSELWKYLLEQTWLKPEHSKNVAETAAAASKLQDSAKTAAAVSKFLGSLLLAGAAYVGFRKLPGQSAG